MEVFDFKVIKVPYINQDQTDIPSVEAGRSREIILEGGRLWRGTTVTLNGQRADKISVLPDMEGVIAHFDCVQPPPGYRHYTDFKKTSSDKRASDPAEKNPFRADMKGLDVAGPSRHECLYLSLSPTAEGGATLLARQRHKSGQEALFAGKRADERRQNGKGPPMKIENPGTRDTISTPWPTTPFFQMGNSSSNPSRGAP